MINISGLSIHFANRYLFDNVSFTINPKDRIGLIGRNGTGKSTLIKIIAGHETPEDGSITMPNDITIGYLPQDGNLESEKSVYEETKTALDEINKLESMIHSISDEISNRTDYESKEYNKLINQLAESNERFKVLGGASIDAEIEKILVGLGFERDEFGRTVNEFSGGWRMRIELAKILLRHPNCIFLDEPTNHLDIESIQWLENFLRNYDGAVMLVSHDRNFLNGVTNRTVEIANGKTYDLNVSYNQFIELREQQKQQQLNAYQNQQKQIAQQERFIERFRYKSTLATRVQSKIKQLEKIDRIELDEEDISAIRLRFPEPPRSNRLVAECISLTKKYDVKLVLDKINFAIEREERVAFVGKNGEGKSTLSKIIAGIEKYDGTLNYGANTVIGYFAQHQAELLNPDETVFDVIDKAATGEMRTKVRSLLGAFLFSGESVEKKVRVLSGGEKSRLALAKLLLQPMNLLILDEPTNHLDMLAKDVLKNALLDYKGAMIIVSHDREFLHGLTNKTIYFKHGAIKEYLGDIYEFLQKHELESLKELELKSKSSGEDSTKKESATKLEREQKKQFQREERKLQKMITECEDEIARLEQQISDLETQFADPDFFNNVTASKEKQNLYNEFKSKLADMEEHWTNLQEELENL